MSQPLVDLQTAGNWRQIYDESRTAQAITEKVFAPLSAFEVGFLFESHILAVRTLSTTAKAHWRFAGTLSQRFQIGTGGSASPLPTVTAAERAMRLNRTALVRFEQLTSNYELVLAPPYWLRDLRLTIWEYTGSSSDTTERLIETIATDLERIESKIDAVSH